MRRSLMLALMRGPFWPFPAWRLPRTGTSAGRAVRRRSRPGFGMGLAAGLCGLGQGRAAASAVDAMARQPGAAARIQTAMIIGLALIESLALYVFVIAVDPALRAARQVTGTSGTGARSAGRPRPGAAAGTGTPMARARTSRSPRFPEMTVRRLSVYTRCLLQLEEDGVKTVSSQELAERFNLNSAQVRKDLAYFGEFGVRGIGYYVAGLKAELQRILGLDREWPVALVGFGNLGLGALPLQGLRQQGFRIAAIFDDDPAKAGNDGGRRPDRAHARSARARPRRATSRSPSWRCPPSPRRR